MNYYDECYIPMSHVHYVNYVASSKSNENLGKNEGKTPN